VELKSAQGKKDALFDSRERGCTMARTYQFLNSLNTLVRRDDGSGSVIFEWDPARRRPLPDRRLEATPSARGRQPTARSGLARNVPARVTSNRL